MMTGPSPFDRADSVHKRIFNEFNSEKQLGRRDGCPSIVVVVFIFFPIPLLAFFCSLLFFLCKMCIGDLAN